MSSHSDQNEGFRLVEEFVCHAIPDSCAPAPMKRHELISPAKLRDATEAMAQDRQFVDRIAWWLRHAHSAEHWFQFEWAYHLQNALVTTEWTVACEVRSVDVVFLPAKDNCTQPAAGIEIKWYGNWWIDGLKCVLGDIGKVDGYDFPAAAALFFLDVTPNPRAERLSWIATNQNRPNSGDDFSTRVEQCVSRPADESFPCALAPHAALEKGVLSFYLWYNQAYKSEAP